MIKKIFPFFIALIVFFGIFLSIANSSAQTEKPIFMTLFFGETCPHCAKEEVFLKKLQEKYPSIQIRYLEIYNNPDNAALLKETAQELNVTVPGVPFLVIGDEAIVGYLNDETTGEKIKGVVEQHRFAGCRDFVGNLLESQSQVDENCEDSQVPEGINLPWLGEVDIKSWSLPFLTMVIGVLDGFNPCAMWVLIFLISLLLGIQDKRKMWILGSAFILSSGIVYFLFLSAWLNLFLFLGFIAIIRILIGLVAVGSGAYHLREYYVNKNAVCKATGAEKKKKIMDRLREITEQKSFWLALGGIIILAFVINLVELVCSAGLPAIYTQILSLANLPAYQYYLYLLLYIFFFMLDDMIVFAIAMISLKAFGFDGKLSRWSNLIGGIIITILGILLLFKPEWIMFG